MTITQGFSHNDLGAVVGMVGLLLLLLLLELALGLAGVERGARCPTATVFISDRLGAGVPGVPAVLGVGGSRFCKARSSSAAD